MTLRNPCTNQDLTDPIRQALYNQLFQPEPVGLALSKYYARLGSLYTASEANRRAFNEGQNTKAAILYTTLAARDIQSMVILGDPTAMLSKL
ncbi:MAG: hypothetical protein NVS2B14_14410 [Chamaesiphon sp.]